MPTIKDAARGPMTIVSMLALAVVVAGCQLIVEEPHAGPRDSSQRNAMSTAIADLPAYDVAVSAIDFDPPLKQGTLFDNQTNVKLLAAVENKGTMPLSQLVVEARVISQNGDFSAHDKAVIDSLSPGETKVVEFKRAAPFPMVPKSPYYNVRVTVASQQPGTELKSASREVIVRVVDSSSQ